MAKKCILAICIAFSLICTLLFTGCETSENWVRSTIEKNYYRFDGDYSFLEELDGLSVEDMVAKLDAYSAYYTAGEYASVKADNEGKKSGIGVSYIANDGGGVTLYTVVGNSPAKRAGLKAGDIVVAAEYCGDVVDFDSANAFSQFVSARDTNEKFTLILDDGRRTEELAREEYTASYACMYLNDVSYEIEYEGNTRIITEGEEGISVLPEGTAYIYLSQFYGNAAEEISALIHEFNARKCTSLVLDLRGNGGGYVEVMQDIGGIFTSALGAGNYVAMEARYKSGKKEIRYCKTHTEDLVPAGTSVYVMADINTASASEALIGILVSYGIVSYENIFLSQYEGREARSYGKGIMQSIFPNYITGEVLKLTVAGIYWQNGKTIHEVGLTVKHGCAAVPAGDAIVNVGYDGELEYVIEKIIKDGGQNP